VTWKWLSRLWKPLEREPNDKCPVCDRPVVAAPDRYFSSAFGGIMAARTKEELTAACVVHGRSPFNDDTRRFFERHPGDA